MKGLYDFEIYNEKNHNLYDWYFAIINAVSQSDIKICFSDQSTVIVRPERAEPVDVEDLRKYHNLVHHMQVEYLHWIKKKFNLNLTPENVVYDYIIACGR